MALAIVLFAVGGLLAGRVVRCGDLRGAGPSATDWSASNIHRAGRYFFTIAGEVVDYNA
jgi:hypothetical protein